MGTGEDATRQQQADGAPSARFTQPPAAAARPHLARALLALHPLRLLLLGAPLLLNLQPAAAHVLAAARQVALLAASLAALGQLAHARGLQRRKLLGAARLDLLRHRGAVAAHLGQPRLLLQVVLPGRAVRRLEGGGLAVEQGLVLL